jgi:hypothetical protein
MVALTSGIPVFLSITLPVINTGSTVDNARSTHIMTAVINTLKILVCEWRPIMRANSHELYNAVIQPVSFRPENSSHYEVMVVFITGGARPKRIGCAS